MSGPDRVGGPGPVPAAVTEVTAAMGRVLDVYDAMLELVAEAIAQPSPHPGLAAAIARAVTALELAGVLDPRTRLDPAAVLRLSPHARPDPAGVIGLDPDAG